MSCHKPIRTTTWPKILLSFLAFFFAPKPTLSQVFPVSVYGIPTYSFIQAPHLGAKPASSLSLNSLTQPIREFCWLVLKMNPSLSMCHSRCCHPTPISAKIRNYSPSFHFSFSFILPFKSYTNSWDLASQLSFMGAGGLSCLLLSHRSLALGLQTAGAQ